MKKFFNTFWPFLACVAAWAVATVLFDGCDRELRRENERLREELARQQQYVPLQRDTIRDTVEVVTQKVVEVERIKEVLADQDKQLLKDLGMKVKELESLQKMGSVIRDTVFLESTDTMSDAPLVYRDAWAEFEYHKKRLRYSVRDSIAIALRKEYKHRFLWFRWGVKGYEVKVVNFNPHATIRYNTFVKRKE